MEFVDRADDRPAPISITRCRAFSYLRTIEDRNERVVAQIFPRWNPLTSWMRQIEDFQRAA